MTGGQRACASADGGGELRSAQPGEHSARAAPPAGLDSRLPSRHLPWRLHDRRPQTAQHADTGQVSLAFFCILSRSAVLISQLFDIQVSCERVSNLSEARRIEGLTRSISCRLEGEARGIYSGSLGFIAFNGAFDLNIVIRTAILSGDRIKIGAGGAIVVQSDPCDEYEEMRLKAKALLSAIGKAEGSTIPPDVDEG